MDVSGKDPSAAEYIQALFESAPNGVAALGPDGALRLPNSQLARMFGYPAEELRGLCADRLFAQASRPEFGSMREEVAGNAGARARRDLVGWRKDGSEFPVEVVVTVLKPAEEGTLLMVVIDASERRKAEERQQLLIGELHHRTQNIFAVIQSVASRSLTGERTLEEARTIFVRRLQALSRTYTMLTEGAWEGALLETILRDELAAFSGRIEVEGPAVMIRPSAAQTFAMIFHELATNALRHGALSAPGGQLSVRWEVRPIGAQFRFVWKESGGPPVIAPTRKGFGRTLLEDGARHIGRAEIAYAAAGLRYRLKAPLASIGWLVGS